MTKRSSKPKRSRSATPVHHLKANSNGLDSFGFVWTLDGEHNGTKMFSMGSATGPVSPIYKDMGPLKAGVQLKLAFDYDTNDYAVKTGGWSCEVVRINVKTVTVKSLATNRTHRLDL